MDRVDYVIDSSPDQDSAVAEIMRMARQEHGDAIIDTMIDTAGSEDEAVERVTRAARRTKLNKEQQPMVDVPGLRDISTPEQWYGGLKNTTVLAKPLTFLTTPITEALRAPFKYAAENIGENTSQTPPIDTAAEYDSLYPSDRAGAGLLVRDMANAFGIKGEPIADFRSEDYPKASEFLTQMTDPVNLAGAGADLIAGAKLPQMGVVSGAASSIEDAKTFSDKAASFMKQREPSYNPARRININPETGRIGSIDTPDLRGMVMSNRHPTINLDAAVQYVEAITKDKKLLAELKKTGRIYDVAKRIVAEPEKYLHQFKPEKIYDTIQGGVDKFRGKRIGQGELDNLLQSQEVALDNLPQDQYSVPAEELQIAALAELDNMGQMEAGQRQSARNYVENNIPVMQPDPAKIERIQTARAARKQGNYLDRQIKFGLDDLKEEITNIKRKMMADYNQVPDLIENPAYREDLQWLSDIEAHISDGSDVYPKQYPQERPRPTEFYQAMADHLDQNIRQAGRTLSQDEKLAVLKDFYQQVEPNFHGPSTLEDVALSPRDNKWTGVTRQVKNDKILPIIQGEQNNPKMIPNPAKAEAQRAMVDRIVVINDEIKNLTSKPATAANNQKLLQMTSERAQLKKLFEETFDPSVPTTESYVGMIRKRNEKPAGYATSTRRLGNKLMEPAIPGEVSTDIAAKNVAGRAMERAGRNAEQQIMSNADIADQIIYNAQNKKISDLIDLRDLTSGNLTTNGPLDNVYIPSGPQGTTGSVSAISRGMDRYVRPTIQEGTSFVANQAAKLGNRGGIMMGSGIEAANEFIYSKAPINSYKIPRNTEEAAAQADMVTKKLEREFGKEVAHAFQDATTQEEVQNLFMNLSRMNPNAFAASKYMAIDGKISDPIMKQMALEDIVKSKGSAYQNANRAENLLINNKVEE